tara:strand:- start:1211 stop:1789 length:579 start_codon:yes stop_codon:yes gene_type:complete
MIKQKVHIINFNILYEILDEIKENLPFNIQKYEDVIDYDNIKKSDNKNFLVISSLINKTLDIKNLLIINDLPISLTNLVEIININLIKIKFNHQSKIHIKNYELNLNSKFICKDNINLKLTEKEIEIILYLDAKNSKHNVLDLQKNIWGYTSDLETHTVETHIYRLRKKVSDKFNDKDFIKSHVDGYFIEKK